MEGKRKSRDLHTHPTLSSLLCVAYLLRYALAFSHGNEVDQHGPSPMGSNSSDLPVCVDTHPTPDLDKIVILWDRLNLTECSVINGLVLLTIVNPEESIGGLVMAEIVSNKQYNLSVLCSHEGIKRTGSVQFQRGKQETISSECTKADWLKTKGVNNLTICVKPLSSGEELLLTYNATTPMERCFINEYQQNQEKTKKTLIHVLPFAVTIHQNASSSNSSFSVECFYPPLNKFFTAGPISSNGDVQSCSTKYLVVKDTDNVPHMSPVHQSFVTVHMGLFATFVLTVVICIVLVTMFIARKVRQQRRRQGQRLLVNEDGDEAAFREYREMES